MSVTPVWWSMTTLPAALVERHHPPRHRRRPHLWHGRMIVGTIPDPGCIRAVTVPRAPTTSTSAFRKCAHQQRATRAHDHVAQIAIERQRPRRGPARRGQRHQLAARAGHVDLVAVLLIGDPARRRADRLSRGERPGGGRRIDRRDRPAAPQVTCSSPAASWTRRPGSSPACSATRARTVPPTVSTR